MPFLSRFCGLFFSFCFFSSAFNGSTVVRGCHLFGLLSSPFQSSWLPFLRKIRHRRRHYRGCSSQLAHRRGAGGRSRCLESRFRGISVGLSGCRFFIFFEMGSSSFLALLSFAALLCLSCPGCWRSAPVFHISPCPSKVLSLLAPVPDRPTLLCQPAPGCCFPGQFEMLSFPTWGLMFDSTQFFNASSSPWVHPFRVCDFYEFSPVFRDLSSWLSILEHFVTLTSLDAHLGIYTCCALFQNSADLALGVLLSAASCTSLLLCFLPASRSPGFFPTSSFQASCPLFWSLVLSCSILP